MELSDSETMSNKLSSTRPPKLVVTRIGLSSKEEEGMDLKIRSSPKGLMANRNKGGTLKDLPKTQTHVTLPHLLPPPTDLGLLANPNLKKKRPSQDLEEGEVAPQKGSKQQKTIKDPKDKRASSVESRDEAEVRRQQCTRAPQIELEGAPISWDASIWESQQGHANHLALALEQPLLLPSDMEAFRCTRQPDLFMLLKRDLAMVSHLSPFKC